MKFWNEEDDHPSTPPAYGTAGWTKDGQSLLFNSRGRIFDIPRPDTCDLYKLHAKNLPVLAALIVEHPIFHYTVDFCNERGLTPLLVWRPLTRAAA